MIESQDRHAAVRMLNAHLAKSGLAAYDRTTDGLHFTRVTHGLGWCQAAATPPEAWPPGATQCLRVFWYPDPAFQRDPRTGRVPAGATSHWTTGAEAALAAVRALGFRAAVTGPPQQPERNTSVDILIWQPGPGTPQEWPPAGAWDAVPPTRPNFVDGWPRWPDRTPQQEIRHVLRNARTQRQVADCPAVGEATAWPADGALWPPFAFACARVVWQPDVRFARRPDGTVPAGAAEHRQDGLRQMHNDLRTAGYRVQQAQTPPPDQHDWIAVLAWRGNR
ncbi:hypothetical protein [Kitasatospora purpeofusca]|uniref:hypothetical protein n=1 Tax=Kitasatospora purpeofusca TaxID=67352 RepID=UPI003F4AC236